MSGPDTPATLMDRLLEIAPGFQPVWEEHLKYWSGQPAGICNDTSEFCRYLLGCYESGKTDWFPRFFALVEDLIREGTAQMREIAMLGLLETLQVQASHREHGEGVFLQWLGPLSRETWVWIDAQWRQHGNLMDIVRSERADEP
ncbi:MAG: hypothetical protein JXQ73_23600 [Phycisphaerae bacterium]|nr:hypothetical protein [Phycisphaerae bacterium]